MNEISSAVDPNVAASVTENPSVLLVDDDSRNLTALSEILADLGARIVCVSSGRDALRAVLREDFAVILLDVRMPDMDGYETAALIRQREKSHRTPLIFLTAIDKDEANVFRGYSSGAVDYVFKPVEPIILRAKVSAFIDLHNQANEILRQAKHERLLLEENLRIRAAKLEAEDQLRSVEERQAVILRSLPIVLYEGLVVDGTLARHFVHDNVLRIQTLGGMNEDKSRIWAERVHPQDWPSVVAAFDRLAKANECNVQYRWKCADGNYRHFIDQCVVASRESDGRLKVFGTILDVHERKVLEQQLIHSQKMDAIGRLTGGIVHDFGNMLWIIISNLEAMRGDSQLDPAIMKRLELALMGALHCRDMTKRLLGFARQQPLHATALDLSTVIEDLADLFGRTLSDKIKVRRELARDLWAVFADQGQIEAAVVNLVVNAQDAMPDGGTLTIRTENVALTKRPRGSPELPSGPYVMLEIADTGQGMTDDVLAHALEPFFTTKDIGRGTGLGLSTTYGFIKQSGGDLVIMSEPRKGTTIRIYLPRHDGPVINQSIGIAASGDKIPREQKSRSILTVDDDPDVRKTTVDLLRGLGYRVLEARSGVEALKTLERADGIDLLVTDLVMPGKLNGYELAREALLRWPGLKVLYISAHAHQGGLEKKTMPACPFLQKPFQNRELEKAVRDALR